MWYLRYITKLDESVLLDWIKLWLICIVVLHLNRTIFRTRTVFRVIFSVMFRVVVTYYKYAS